MFLLQWESGDQTWLLYAKIKHLQPLQEYFKTLGIRNISQLPPILSNKELIEGTSSTDNLFAGAITVWGYKREELHSDNISFSLNYIVPFKMSTITFFAPTDFPELNVHWEEHKLEIAGMSDGPPFMLMVDEMVLTIQMSLALGRGWNVTVSPRYSDIASTINLIIPIDSEAYLSFIDNGKLHHSNVFVTYEHFFVRNDSHIRIW
ncbi:hypothetical protein GGU10DRAFT_372979 [Lentinula aff. detonsa]|uniref:Uncharacterized protein n=1 Tax=Lentinula aff. detonsa TaxID=2804958 RepID=A0AA38NNB4_9AGAR|nr:hypothetical protein GGU10DRAFT_372979 [Lentinula aff. detonsa]